MASTSDRLPKRFPVGTKYVVEGHGSFVTRYLEFPNGRRVVLAKRRALPCGAVGQRPPGASRSRKSSDQREALRATATV
jgi:hypothetical protein